MSEWPDVAIAAITGSAGVLGALGGVSLGHRYASRREAANRRFSNYRRCLRLVEDFPIRVAQGLDQGRGEEAQAEISRELLGVGADFLLDAPNDVQEAFDDYRAALSSPAFREAVEAAFKEEQEARKQAREKGKALSYIGLAHIYSRRVREATDTERRRLIKTMKDDFKRLEPS